MLMKPGVKVKLNRHVTSPLDETTYERATELAIRKGWSLGRLGYFAIRDFVQAENARLDKDAHEL